MEEFTLQASRTARRVQCPGSRGLELTYPGEQSTSEREGETAHIVAHRMLANKKISPEYPQDMIDGAKLYVDFINDTLHKLRKQNPKFLVENYLTYEIPSATSKIFVTARPDCYIYTSDVLYVIDYKFGHRTVSPRYNWQLISYAYGIIQSLGDTPLKIKLVTVQPRIFDGSDKIKKWDLTIDQLQRHFNTLIESEYNSTKYDAQCTPGPECGLCNAKHACLTLQSAALQTAQMTHAPTAKEYSPDQIGAELRYLEYAKKILDARILGLSEQATNILKGGKSVRGYELKPGRGNLIWSISLQEIETLGILFGLDLFKDPQPITPTQALKKGLNEDIVKNNSKKEPGSWKLTQIDESETADIFSEIVT